MGIFDFFTGGEDGQIKRHAKRVRNLNAQVEDREVSAHWLAENGTEEAITALLGRYTITYEHRMKDAKEKELVLNLLLGLGKKACGPIKDWVRKNENFARPLQVVEEHEGAEVVVDLLLEMLGREVDPFKPEKKRQILIKLSEYIDDRVAERVPALLEDFDEGVRYAAVEALLVQEHPVVQPELAKALGSRQEESNRLRVRIAEAFHKRSWSLGDYAQDIAERPPHGWVVREDRIFPV